MIGSIIAAIVCGVICTLIGYRAGRRSGPTREVVIIHGPPDAPLDWIEEFSDLAGDNMDTFMQGVPRDAAAEIARPALAAGFRKGWREAMEHVRLQFGGKPREPGVYPL